MEFLRMTVIVSWLKSLDISITTGLKQHPSPMLESRVSEAHTACSIGTIKQFSKVEGLIITGRQPQIFTLIWVTLL